MPECQKLIIVGQAFIVLKYNHMVTLGFKGLMDTSVPVTLTNILSECVWYNVPLNM